MNEHDVLLTVFLATIVAVIFTFFILLLKSGVL